MPFPKLQVDRHLMTWSQMIDVLKEVSAHNRPKLWAIANLLGGLDEGMTREEYAVGFCIGGRQLRRWIHRFNSGGVEGLLYRRPRRRRRKSKISVEKFESELLPLVKKLRASDYNPSGRKLWQLAKTKLGCDISYPGMMRTLRREAISFRRPGGQ